MLRTTSCVFSLHLQSREHCLSLVAHVSQLHAGCLAQRETLPSIEMLLPEWQMACLSMGVLSEACVKP